MQNEQIIEVIEEISVQADAYNNCCHFLIGQADVESRD